MKISNKQVIAIFVLGVALLLIAFWAGLNVVKQDTNLTEQPAATGRAPQGARATSGEAAPPDDARFVVHVATFGTLEKAKELETKLRRVYPSAKAQEPGAQDTLYRVELGPYKTRDEALQVVNELAAEGYKGLMIKQR